MDIGRRMTSIQRGEILPVYILEGSEGFLIERCVSLLRSTLLGDDAGASLNLDLFQGAKLKASTILQAARTLPMFATKRLVLVRNTEGIEREELDPLTEYMRNPCDSSCVVFLAEKLDGRTSFVKTAKQKEIWTEVETPKGAALRTFVLDEAKARGRRMAAECAEALIEFVGTDLAALDDSIERLSLYVGTKTNIEMDDIESCITRTRVDSIWSLVDAVSASDMATALRCIASLLDGKEPPLRILAMIARQIRITARFRDALASGSSPQDAAKVAGLPPFKARETSQVARRFGWDRVARSFSTLSEADRALKGSKRHPHRILEEAVISLCQ